MTLVDCQDPDALTISETQELREAIAAAVQAVHDGEPVSKDMLEPALALATQALQVAADPQRAAGVHAVVTGAERTIGYDLRVYEHDSSERVLRVLGDALLEQLTPIAELVGYDRSEVAEGDTITLADAAGNLIGLLRGEIAILRDALAARDTALAAGALPVPPGDRAPMPYLVVVTNPRRLDQLEAAFESAGGRGVELADEIDRLRNPLRHLVLTLEEAHDRAIDAVPFGLELDEDLWRELQSDVRALEAAGGQIGPLPDGSVIAVQPVPWDFVVGGLGYGVTAQQIADVFNEQGDT